MSGMSPRISRPMAGLIAPGLGGLLVRASGQTPDLPASAVAAWHSEIDCSASSWTDYIGGRVLTGINNPVVATDGANFNGRVVAQSEDVANRAWRATGLTQIVAAGTRPWTYAIFRLRATTTDQGLHGIMGGASVATIQRLSTTTGPVYTGLFKGTVATTTVSTGAADTGVHRAKLWADGTNLNVTIDDTNSTAAWAGQTTDPLTAAAIGTNVNNANFSSDASHAFFLVCSAKPTAPEEAALDAWAAAYFGAA